MTLLDLKTPDVQKLRYALDGSVRYENVEGKSYLEMWSWFADGGMYFSRTLGDLGPMQSPEGSSDWRPFTLPFIAESGPPIRIVFNVVFLKGGTVYLVLLFGVVVTAVCGGLLPVLRRRYEQIELRKMAAMDSR